MSVSARFGVPHPVNVTMPAQIIKRSNAAQGFGVLPRRRVVERIFDRLGRCHGVAKDNETAIESATAWILVARGRRLARVLSGS